MWSKNIRNHLWCYCEYNMKWQILHFGGFMVVMKLRRYFRNVDPIQHFSWEFSINTFRNCQLMWWYYGGGKLAMSEHCFKDVPSHCRSWHQMTLQMLPVKLVWGHNVACLKLITHLFSQDCPLVEILIIHRWLSQVMYIKLIVWGITTFKCNTCMEDRNQINFDKQLL